jgi:putative membrane protein
MTVGATRICRILSIAAIVIWLACTTLSIFQPDNPIAKFGWYILTTALVIFSFTHGAVRYGWLNILVLFIIAFIIGNISENLSISTGFPFGFYTHTPAMGPKLFLVPVVIGPFYFAVCYIVWTLTEMILGKPAPSRPLDYIIGSPIVAALIVTGFDMCVDPIGATIQRHWIYANGGGYFGVPMSNYVGWFINAWAIFECFALFLAKRPETAAPTPPAYWYEVSVLWGLMGLQYPVLLLATPGSVAVRDSGGWMWRSGDILQNAAIVGVYTMILAALMSVLAKRSRVVALVG